MLGGLILAAGRGRRMGDLTDDKPKTLLMHRGETLFNRIIDNFVKCQIQDIAIVRGYRKELLIDNRISDYFENTRWATTNILRSLLAADEFLSAHDTIVSYADIFYDQDAVKQLIEAKDDLALTSNMNFLTSWQARFEDIFSDIESFIVNEQEYLIEIGQRVSSLDSVQGQYMGLFKITSKAWQNIREFLTVFSEEQLDAMDMTSFFNLLLENNIKIKTVPYHGAWGEMDTAEDYALYSEAC